MTKMLAAVLHDFNDLHLEEVPIPTPDRNGAVVVNIKATGFCATDYKAITGPAAQRHLPLHRRA